MKKEYQRIICLLLKRIYKYIYNINMKYPIELYSSTLGLSWDKDGKAYNYRSLEKIVIDGDDIIQMVDHYDDKDRTSNMNFTLLVMTKTKYGEDNKIQVAEDIKTIQTLISDAKNNVTTFNL